MSLLSCPNCGASSFTQKGRNKVCDYCNSTFDVWPDNTCKSPGISLFGDIETLLMKCKTEPFNAKKYANLILDIDPTNIEAKKYIK